MHKENRKCRDRIWPNRAKSESVSSSESSSSKDEKDILFEPKHMMKPPKFDGQSSFESFMAQFSNCAEYNKWNRTQKLAYLRNSLEKEAANILWDYGENVKDSLSGLKKTLEMRFGGKAFPDKHRIELRNRRRKQNESLQSLHGDIRRLAALALPDMPPQMREVIACDHFLDALGDPDFAMKIRERQPTNLELDSALRIALQLEAWTTDTTRCSEATKNKEVELKHVRKVLTRVDCFVRNFPKKFVELEKRIDCFVRNFSRKFAELEKQNPKKPKNGGFPNNYRQQNLNRHTAPNYNGEVSSAPPSLRGPNPVNCPNNFVRPPGVNKMNYNGNFNRLRSCRRISQLSRRQDSEESGTAEVSRQKSARSKRAEQKSVSKQQKSYQRSLPVKSESAYRNKRQVSEQNKVNDQNGTTKVTPQGTLRTRQELLKSRDELRKKFVELKQQKDVSAPAMRVLSEELDEIDKWFAEWENQFFHRISASVCVSAEASFVGEATAQRCGWRIYESKKRTIVTRAYGIVAVTGMVDVPIRIGQRMLSIQLFVSPCVEDFLVLGKDVVSRVKATQEQLLLTLTDGEVIDTPTEDHPFRMSFEATYVSEENEQEGGDFEGNSTEKVREDEQAATASRMKVSESASNRTDSELPRCRDAKQRPSLSHKGTEQQLVSRSEPSASEVKESEDADEVLDNEQCPDVHGPGKAITVVKSRKTSELGTAPSIIEESTSTLILVGRGLQEYEGEKPRMWSTAEVASNARRDGDREGATGPYIPSFSANDEERHRR